MQEYYMSLVKPSFAPSATLFGPVWTVLYIIIAISFVYMIWRVYKKKSDSKIIVPMILNLVANACYTPIMFTLKSNLFATIDIVVVLISIIWMIVLTYKKEKYFMMAQIPYLLWVSFASILQFYILFNN